MEIYKKAVIADLRFNTAKGMLNIQQLYQLSLTDLSNAIKAVKKLLKKNEDEELSFLSDERVVDDENQLRFDILKDVYLTKKDELETLRDAARNKEHNAKIDAIIAAKKDAQLNNMTIEELEALRK